MSGITIDDVLKDVNKNEEVQSIKTASKKAGRPKKEGERASERVVIYLTPSQLKELEDYCHETRQKVGTFIKDTFFEKFYGEKKEEKDIFEEFIERLDEREIGELIKKYLMAKK